MPRDPHDSLSERDRRDITALADGALSDRRRAAVEARIAASPELRGKVDRQRRAIAALHAVEAPVPATLRDTIAAEWPAPRPRRLPRLAWAGAAAAAVAAVAVAVIVLAGGGGAPTIDEAAGLAALPPTEPAPEPRPDQPTLLAAEAEGLAYPNWSGEFGWKAAGERADRVGDRDATTVYYEKEGDRIGYTIVSGDSLGRPPDAATTTVEGVEFAVARDGERTIVTWLRGGHSCVLSGEDVDRSTLVELAAWRGDGAVAF